MGFIAGGKIMSEAKEKRGIPMKYMGGIVMETFYCRQYKNEETGIVCEVVTKRKHGVPVGKGERRWYHPIDKEIYPTFAEAKAAAVENGFLLDEEEAK